jgi:hypothetical protein
VTFPAGLPTSLCTGHGICIPMAVHYVGSCGTACPPLCPTYPVLSKNATCFWPPLICTPLTPYPGTVLVNGQIPLRMGDPLILHRAACTNLVIEICCTPGGCTIRIFNCDCSLLATEDALGAGHPRIVNALTKSVFVEKRPMASVGDPLGPVCLSYIGTGSPNVLVGL